jgi:hypothetical protein
VPIPTPCSHAVAAARLDEYERGWRPGSGLGPALIIAERGLATVPGGVGGSRGRLRRRARRAAARGRRRPERGGPDGRTPHRVATAAGRSDLVELLRRHGAHDDATGVDRFLARCLSADRAAAERLLAADPVLLATVGDEGRATLVRAVGVGATDAVALVLDLGFPIESRGSDGGIALHAAAYGGQAATVRLLLERGADREARDTTWGGTPLEWAAVRSGERSGADEAARWVETVSTLLGYGASTDGLAVSRAGPKAPSPEVGALLRAHGEHRSA